MFMPNSLVSDNALLLSLVHFAVRYILHPHVMQSKDCSLALILLLQILHVFSAVMVVFFYLNRCFYLNRFFYLKPLTKIKMNFYSN